MEQTDEQRRQLLAAAEWWLRLRRGQAGDEDVDDWLDWSAKAPGNIGRFERIHALGTGLAAASPSAKAALLDEFAPRRRRWPMALAAGVAACALFMGTLVWSPRAPETLLSQRYATEIGVNRDVQLPDGSRLAIGADSALELHFDTTGRQLALDRGEAFVEVAKDAQRPFVIDAGSLRVRAVGTAFNVRRTDSQVAVTVTEGRVRVTLPSQPATAGGELEVVAGQRVAYDAMRGRLALASIDTQRALGWRNNRLEFVDEPLDVVVANINRYSPRQLRLADSRVAELRFTGTIRPSRIDGWLTALPEILPVRVDRHEGNATIRTNE